MCIQETKTFVEFQAIKSSFPVPYMRKCFTPTDLSFCLMVFFLISCYEIEYNITCQVRLIKRHIRFFSKSHLEFDDAVKYDSQGFFLPIF